MLTRRALVAGFAPGFLSAADDKLAALEKRSGGRLGVCILDTATGRETGNRLDERFAMCSSFKMLLAATALREAERGQLSLDEVLRYGAKDLIANSPVTQANVGRGGMSIGALAEATQKTSDNTAANLLVRRLGGPEGLTRKWREMGDAVTRLDRYEPEMNRVEAGDARDTTTPRGMARMMSRLFLKGGLSAASRDRLLEWMIATETGAKRLRAGLPKDWRSGDKTGSMWGGVANAKVTDKINDIAITWPAGGGAPLIITCFYDTPRISEGIRDEDQAVLAEVGRFAAATRESRRTRQ